MKRNFTEKLHGGRAAGHRPSEFDPEQLAHGAIHEMEHTDDIDIAIQIAMDHLAEDPDYYEKLTKMEMQANGPEVGLIMRVGAIIVEYAGPALRALAPEIKVLARQIVVLLVEGASVKKIADYLEKKGLTRKTADQIAEKSHEAAIVYTRRKMSPLEHTANGKLLTGVNVLNKSMDFAAGHVLSGTGRHLKRLGRQSEDAGRATAALFTGGLSEDALAALKRRRQAKTGDTMKRNASSKSESREDLVEAIEGLRVRLFDSDQEHTHINYGSWYDRKDGDWIVPTFLSGSDYSGGAVVRANQRSFLEGWPDGIQDGWMKEATGGYRTRAFVIHWKTCPLDVLQALAGLSDYPLLDEMALSEQEHEEENEALENFYGRELARLIYENLSVDPTDYPDWMDVLSNVLMHVMERENLYWEHNDEGAHLPVEKIADAITRADLPRDWIPEDSLLHDLAGVIHRSSPDGTWSQVTFHGDSPNADADVAKAYEADAAPVGPIWVPTEILYELPDGTLAEILEEVGSRTPPHGAAAEQLKLFENRSRRRRPSSRRR